MIFVAVDELFAADVEAIRAHRHDQGGDYWTTPDHRLLKGSPFNMLECMQYLLELGVEPQDPDLQAAAALLWNCQRPDGRFRIYPKGAIFPCQTAHAAQILCQLGQSCHPRLQVTMQHLLDTQQLDGGWRCEKYFFGRGPETAYSNPYPTLIALDALRRSGRCDCQPALERAAEFLLAHWDIKKPIGPCHYGIGSRFMQVEYPFRGYNLFLYVYVLSHLPAVRGDRRFLEAFHALQKKTLDGQIVVERVVPKLAGLSFCKKGQPSSLATARYREILQNLG